MQKKYYDERFFFVIRTRQSMTMLQTFSSIFNFIRIFTRMVLFLFAFASIENLFSPVCLTRLFCCQNTIDIFYIGHEFR